MSLLSGSGSTLPNSFQFYDFSSSSFTVPSGATGQIFEITGSRRPFTVNTAKNVTATDASNDERILGIAAMISALNTTNSTDNYFLKLKISIDGGATFADYPATAFDAAAFPGGASQNKSSAKATVAGFAAVDAATAITNNQVLVAMFVEGSADPTSDAFTITNIRGTMAMLVMK